MSYGYGLRQSVSITPAGWKTMGVVALAVTALTAKAVRSATDAKTGQQPTWGTALSIGGIVGVVVGGVIGVPIALARGQASITGVSYGPVGGYGPYGRMQQRPPTLSLSFGDRSGTGTVNL